MRWLTALVLAMWMAAGWAGDGLFLSAAKQSDYQSALDDLHIAIMNNGYVHLATQTVDEGLRQKGYAHPDYRLVFLGNKSDTLKAVAIAPEIAMVLPLKIVIYREGDTVRAFAPSLEMWKEIYRDPALIAYFDKWQRDLREILKDFSQQ